MYPVDEVDGEKFKNTCDFKFGEKIPKKSVSLMYTASDNHKEVLGFILKHPDSQFKLLTHNSDVEIKVQEKEEKKDEENEDEEDSVKKDANLHYGGVRHSGKEYNNNAG